MTLYRDKYGLGVLGLAAFATISVALLGGKSASALDIIPGVGSYTLPADSTEQIVVKKGANVTIDLNGHNLTTANQDSIVVDNGATATIKGDGTVEATGSGVSPIYNNGALTINGGTYLKDESKGAYYAILNHGDLTFNNGTVKMVNYVSSSLVDTGYYNYNDSSNSRQGYVEGVGNPAPKMTINGGTFSGGGNEIKNDDNGYLYVRGGTFIINRPASELEACAKNVQADSKCGRVAIANNHYAEISGGTISASGGLDTALTNNQIDGGHNSGILKISGGTFTAKILVIVNDKADTEITGGTFNISQISSARSFVGDKDDVKTKITGGTFADTVSFTPADGYTTIKNADGTSRVVTKAEAEKIEADKKAAEEAKANADKEVTKPREAQDASKADGNEAAVIAAPNTGAEVASGLNLGSIVSGIAALTSASLAVIAKIKL